MAIYSRANKIKLMMLKKFIPIGKFADQIGISRQALYLILNRKAGTSIETAEKICNQLQVTDIEELFDLTFEKR